MASRLEKLWQEAWEEHGLLGSDMTPEFLFDSESSMRLDFAWPSKMVGIELQGFGWGHQSIKGLARDAVKMRRAIECGWTVFPFTSACLQSKAKRQEAVELVAEYLCCGPVPQRVNAEQQAVIDAMIELVEKQKKMLEKEKR